MLNVKKLLTKIAVLVTGAFTYQEYTYTNYDFSSQQYRSITLSKPTKTGYNPILVKCVVSSHSGIHMFNYRISGNNMIVEGINRTTYAVSNASIVCGIIWVKDKLGGGTN